MSMESKALAEQAKAAQHNAMATAYQFADDVSDTVEQTIDEIRGQHHVSASDRAAEIVDRLSETAANAGRTVKAKANEATARARRGASATAEAVRENPGTTAAIVGGLATAAIAAVAGVRYYRSKSENSGSTPQRKKPAPKDRMAKTARSTQPKSTTTPSA